MNFWGAGVCAGLNCVGFGIGKSLRARSLGRAIFIRYKTLDCISDIHYCGGYLNAYYERRIRGGEPRFVVVGKK